MTTAPDTGVTSATPLRVVAFGTYDIGAHPRVRVLVEGLRAHDVVVDEVNVSSGVPTSDRIGATRGPAAAARTAGALVRSWPALGRRSRDLERPDAVLVGYLGILDVHLARARWPRALLVLDHLAPAAGTVADRGLDRPWSSPLLAVLDRLAEADATLVLCDTDEMRASLPARVRRRAVVVAVGADASWFAARPPLPPSPSSTGSATGSAGTPLRVVHAGAYAPLHGVPVLAEALRRAPDLDVRLTLVGEGQQRAEVEALLRDDPRASFVPWTDPALLPSLVADHDVGVGLLGTTPRAGAVVPTKVFQYAAAGLAVLTADTAPARRALGDGAAAFVPAGDPPAVAAALRDLAADRTKVAALQRAAADRADRAFTPTAVVEPLVAALRQRATPPRLR